MKTTSKVQMTVVVRCCNPNCVGMGRSGFTLSGAVTEPYQETPSYFARAKVGGREAAVLYLPAALCSGFL